MSEVVSQVLIGQLRVREFSPLVFPRMIRRERILCGSFHEMHIEHYVTAKKQHMIEGTQKLKVQWTDDRVGKLEISPEFRGRSDLFHGRLSDAKTIGPAPCFLFIILLLHNLQLALPVALQIVPRNFITCTATARTNGAMVPG